MNKRFRIKKNEEFGRIMNYRHYVSCAAFAVYYSRKKQDVSRVGISASKKLGNAVVRNRIKRQVREMIRTLIDFETYENDLVIIVRKDFLDSDYQTNKNDLEKTLKKAII